MRTSPAELEARRREVRGAFPNLLAAYKRVHNNEEAIISGARDRIFIELVDGIEDRYRWAEDVSLIELESFLEELVEESSR